MPAGLGTDLSVNCTVLFKQPPLLEIVKSAFGPITSIVLAGRELVQPLISVIMSCTVWAPIVAKLGLNLPPVAVLTTGAPPSITHSYFIMCELATGVQTIIWLRQGVVVEKV